MKFLTFILILLPGICQADTAAGKEWVDPYFEESTAPWKEIAARLPPFPKDGNLERLHVSSASTGKYFIDTASISVGADRVVRYTIVIESPRGARTINFEGLRCNTGERKIYAFGESDGKWVQNKYAAWEEIKTRSAFSYHKPLYEGIFCDAGVAVRDAEEALRNMKHPVERY